MIAEYGARPDPILDWVRTCPLCFEDWPDDGEFYRRSTGPCRACEWETLDERRRQVAAAARSYRARLRAARP